MSRNFIKLIILVCAMAGIIFTPACSNIDDKLDNEEEIIIYCIIKTDEVAKKFPQFCNDDFLIIAKGH